MIKKKSKLIALIIVVALAITAIGCSFAYFTDRVNHTMQFTTATFSADGYTLTRKAPEGPFVANEDVKITLSESNSDDGDLTSIIQMSIEWESPDDSISIFQGDKATLIIGGQPVDYTGGISADGKKITFDIPAHTVSSGTSKNETVVALHIPDSFISTGQLSYSFEKVFLEQAGGGFSGEFDRTDLNAAETLDCSTKVGWAASNLTSGENHAKALMGYLSSDGTGIEFEFAFGYTASGIKDFANATASKWSNYKDQITDITFPNSGSVTGIGDYAFAGFAGITELTLPESLAKVGAYAFDGISVTELTLPAKTTTFESMAFGHADKLTKIVFQAASNAAYTLPTAGENTGAFYVDDYVETVVFRNNNDRLKAVNYDWVAENRMKAPVLQEEDVWYTQGSPATSGGTAIPKSKISSIEMVDVYDTTSKTIVDQWDASIYSTGADDNSGPVTAYLEDDGLGTGTYKLTIAGTGYGSVIGNENSESFFMSFKNATSILLGDAFDASNIKNAFWGFNDCRKVTELDIGDWSEAPLENIAGLFRWMTAVETIDVSNFNLSNCESLEMVFCYCNSVKTITGLDTWDVSTIKDFGNLFSSCRSLTDLSDIYSWDMSGAEDFGYTFNGCAGLTELDLRNWVTPNANYFGGMFEGCIDLEYLNISNLDTSKIDDEYDLNSFAKETPSLTTIVLGPKFAANAELHPPESATDSYNMFMATYDNGTDDQKYSESDPLRTVVTGANAAMLNYNWQNDHRGFVVTVESVSGGTFKVGPDVAINGRTVTFTAEPEIGMKYTGATVKYTEDGQNKTISLSAEDSSFTMPKADVTITPSWEKDLFTITYNANGGTFTSGSETNAVTYCLDSTTTKTSKTDNVSADGSTADTNTGYGNNVQKTDVITIPGASKLAVTVTYQTVSSTYDWVAVYDGSVTPSESNYDDSVSGRLGGMTKKTETFIVDGDTAQIYFRSYIYNDGYYGYYAEVRDITPVETSGSYSEPTRNNYNFVGWYTDEGCSAGNEFDPASADSSITVYAKWKEATFTVTYNANGGTFKSGTTNEVTYAPSGNYSKHISKTSNVSNDGSTYGSGYGYVSGKTDTITVPGVSRLYVTITYATHNVNSDWVAVYDGSVTPSSSNYNESISGKLGGEDGNPTVTRTFVVEGDTAKFYFNSDWKDNSSYGYYAIIEAYNSVSGEYEVPIMGTGNAYEVEGWYTDAACSDGAEFDLTTADSDITVYAKWKPIIPILAKEGTWYTQGSPKTSGGTSISNSKISSVELVDTYDATGKTIVDQWDASIYSTGANDNSGPITAYFEDDGLGNGTYKLTIAGNGYGSIVANKLSNQVFKWFSAATSITGLNWLDTQNATNMAEMFSGCSKLTSLDVSHFNTSNVEGYYNTPTQANTYNNSGMAQMFANCSSLTSLDVSNFDTRNVGNMRKMFYYCLNLTDLNISTKKIELNGVTVDTWDTGNVADMAEMFNMCNSLTALDLSHFDTQKVTNMAQMFKDCKALMTLNISTKKIELNGDTFDTWDTGSVTGSTESYNGATSMCQMFQNCSSLTTLDVSHFDTQNVTIMSNMFDRCSNLTTLNVGTKKIELNGDTVDTWDTGSVIFLYRTFWSCSNLTSLDVSHFDTRNVTWMNGTFSECFKLESLNKATGTGLDIRTEKIELNGDTFDTWDTGKVITMSQMFQNCRSLTTLDVSHFDTSNTTQTISMFQGCNNLTSLDIAAGTGFDIRTKKIELNGDTFDTWDTSKVTSMYSMFDSCSKLTTLDVTHFDTSNVTSMYGMFHQCYALTSVDLSNFDTHNVTNMTNMFRHCNSLKTLDLSSFDTSAITSTTQGKSGLTHLAVNCNALTTIILGENFGQSTTVPTAGLNTGMFPIDHRTIKTAIYGANDVMQAYDWQADNRVGFSITVSPAEGGTVTASPTTAFNGKTVTLTITADEYYEYKGATVSYTEGGEAKTIDLAADATSFVMPAADVTITPEWELNIQLERIDVTTPPDKVVYKEGELFDPTGMIVTATYTDGSTKEVTGYTLYPNGELASSFTSITITYTEDGVTKTTSQPITVKAVVPTAILYYDEDTAEYTMVFQSHNVADTETYGEVIETYAGNGGWMERSYNSSTSATDVNAVPWRVDGNYTKVTKVIIEDDVCPEYTNYWFQNASNLTTVIIGDGADELGTSVFQNCSKLTSVDIGDSVDVASNNAFRGCTSLTSIDLNSVTSLGSYAFNGCSNLTSVDSDKLTAVGQDAFSNCSNLTSVDLSSATHIGQNSFRKCSKLTSVDLSNATKINEYAFESCSGLTSVTISAALSKVEQQAFSSCNGLTAVYIDDLAAWCNIDFVSNMSNPLACGKNLYLNGELVQDLVIPDKITRINNYAFYGCKSLTSVDLNNVTTIGNEAFRGCSTLSSVDLKDVTTINNYAFFGCSSLASVIIPDGVSVINDYVFSNCSSLTSVSIPDGVTTIGNYAFNNCSKLPSITIPDSVTKIGESAFLSCQNLTSINIPDGVTSIGNKTFSVCSKLTSIDLNNVTTIGNDAFSYCNSLTSVQIPDSVTTIGNNAFANCQSLINVSIPDSVTKIGDNAFYYCRSLDSIDVDSANANYCSIDGVLYDKNVTTLICYPTAKTPDTFVVPDSVTTIVMNAFYYAQKLRYVDLSNVTTIGNNAFYNTGLYEVDASNVITIGNSAFSSCYSLNSIILGPVETIGSSAFYNCRYLKDIYYVGDENDWSAISFGSGWNSNAGAYTITYNYGLSTGLNIISLPDVVEYAEGDSFDATGMVVKFKSENGDVITLTESDYTITPAGPLSGGVSEITISYTDAESNTYTATVKITVKSETAILYHNAETDEYTIVFQSESTVDTDTYGEVVQTYAGKNGWMDKTYTSYSQVPWYSDGNYAKITNVIINDDVVPVSTAYWFYNCSKLTGVDLGDSLTAIGDYTFYNCTSLTSVDLNNVIVIGNQAFRGCSALSSVDLNNVTTIGDYAFFGCSGFTTIDLCNVSSIGRYAFQSCTSLTSVTIPDSVTTISESVFRDCTSLTSVDLGDSLTAIGDSAFMNCSSLTSVTIPDGVTTIGDGSFRSCKKLTSVSIPSSVTVIERYAFRDCNGLKAVYITDLDAWCNIAYDEYYGDTSSPLYYAKNLYLNGELVQDLVIPETVTHIGPYAFVNCTSLTSVDLNNVMAIGSGAFYGCSNIKDIYVDDLAAWCGINFSSQSSNPAYYAKDLYLNGELQFEVVIPDTVTRINSFAFAGCQNLASVTIPDSVTSIGSQAFYNCSKLTVIRFEHGPEDSLTLSGGAFSEVGTTASNVAPDNKLTYVATTNNVVKNYNWTADERTAIFADSYPTAIVDGVIYSQDMTTLLAYPANKPETSFVVPDSVTTISHSAFWNCNNLITVDASNVTTVEDYAFSCENLTSVDLSNVVTIGRSAFDGLRKLTSVGNTHRLTYVGDSAFYYCSQLNSIDLSNVTEIGDHAFYSCGSLKSVDLRSVRRIGPSAFASSSPSIQEVHVDDLAAWCGISFPDADANPLNDGKAYLYVNGERVIDLVIPDICGRVNNYCFYGYKYLKSVDLNNVTEIGNYAFSGCSGLTSINIPDSVTTIGKYAFNGCGLTSVSIPDSVTTISESTFSSCRSLTSVIIPDSVTTIDKYAFYDCRYVANIYYTGSEDDWNNISFGTNWDYYASNNVSGGKYTITYNYTPPVVMSLNANGDEVTGYITE